MTFPLLKTKGAFLLLALLLPLFLWKAPFYTQDGPNHKKVAVILKRLPESPIENIVYKNNLGLTRTNVLFPLLYQPLSRLFSIDGYEKIFVGFFLILIPIAYRYFLSTGSPGSEDLWPLALPLWFHPLFWRGMYNFLASVPLTVFALAFFQKDFIHHKRIYFIFFLLICWIAFLAHPFPFFILPAVILLSTLFDLRKTWKRAIPYLAVSLFFLVLGFILPFFRENAQGHPIPFSFASIPELIGGLWISNMTAFSKPELMLFLPFLLCLAALTARSLKTVPLPQKIFWIAFLFLYSVFPKSGQGGGYLNERFLIYLWLFLPLGVILAPRPKRVVQGISLLTLFLLGGGMWMGLQKIQPIVSEAEGVLRAMPSGSRLYPIQFNNQGPALTYYKFLVHLWANHEDSKIAFSPYLFAYNDLMPLVRRRSSTPTYFPSTGENYPERVALNALCTHEDWVETLDCASLRKGGFDTIVQKAFFYEYWFIHQPPSDFLALLQNIPGLEKVAETGSSSLWHYEKARSFEPSL